MEVKTSEQIEWWLFEQSKNNPKNSEHIKKQMESKQWVSVESLRKVLLDDSILDVEEYLKENILYNDLS